MKSAMGSSEPTPDPDADTNKYSALVNNDVRDLWERIIREEPVCPEWKESYATFRDQIGERPTEQHTLRLYDINEFYCKSNCYWGTEDQDPPKKKRRSSFIAD